MIPLFMQHGRSKPASPIASLFTAGLQGVWYDPSDFNTLFQDSEGTIPVTAVGQSVGLMLDKSGNGNHAVQASSAKRPELSQDANGCYSLSWDGVDDAITVSSVDFSGTDKVTVMCGITRSTNSTSMLFEFGPANVTNGFRITSGSAYFAFSGSTGRQTTSVPAVDKSVLSISFDRPLPTNAGGFSIRRNGAVGMTTSTSTAMRGGNFGNLPLYLGSRANIYLPFKGNMYSVVILGASATSDQIKAVESYIAQKTGVTL